MTPTDDALDTRPIRARLNAATRGPWFAFRDNNGGGTEVLIASKIGAARDAFDAGTCEICAVDGANEDAGLILGWGNGVNVANAEFIAHSHVDVERLLAEVDRLQAALNLMLTHSTPSRAQAAHQPAQPDLAEPERPAGTTA